MSTGFDAFDDLLSAAVVTAYGEVAIIKPRVSSPYAERSADANRQQMQLWGVFSAGPNMQQLKGQVSSGTYTGTTRIGQMGAEFWISREQAEALAFMPAKGDTFSLPGRSGEPIYAISSIQKTDRGDMMFLLVREDETT